MIQRLSGSIRRRGQGGFTLIELLVVIAILGILAGVVVFSVRGISDRGEGSAQAIDARTMRTAQEAFRARFGVYATEDQLAGLENAPDGSRYNFIKERSSYTDVVLKDGGAGYTLTQPTTAVVNVAANADQWITSDAGSGPGYSSSAFVYPLNSNMYDPLIIMNSDYTLSGGLAASWERIPVGTNRSTVNGTGGTPAPLPSTPTPYPTCGGIADRPFCTDTWRFHLRQGVTFHDGQTFDADDLVWTWRDRQPISGSPSSGQNTLRFTRSLAGTTGCASAATVCTWDSVEKIDAYTVDFTPGIQNLRFPEQVLHPKGAIAPVLRDAAGNPVPSPASEQTPGLSSPRHQGRHLDGSTGGLPAGTTNLGVAGSPAATPRVPGTPQGTGPFKYVSYSPTSPQGGGTAAFERFPGYWGAAKAAVAGMNYTFIADPAVRTAGLQSGQYDMAIDLNPLDMSAVKATGKRVVTAPYGQNTLIYVNKVVKDSPATLDYTKVGPATPPNYRFNIGTDPAVRRALSLSFDRQAYIDAIFAGNASPGRWMSPPGVLGAYQNLVSPMVTDPALARTVLDSAGWTCGGGAPGAGTACGTDEFRTWRGADTSKFSTGRELRLYMVGISLVPQAAYDLLAAQAKVVGINLINQRGSCDSAIVCPDGTVGRGQMYNSSLWDLDLELPNQNDANAAFLPVLRQACVNQTTTFRFAPADGTNGVAAPVNDTAALGGGTYPFGKTPCTAAGAALGPMDATWVPQSQTATTPAVNQEAAANMMRILVNQDQTNVVIPVAGQFRIYGMTSKTDLGDPHPSQTSQRWITLTKSA